MEVTSSTTIRFAVGDCSLGTMLVACSDRGTCAIQLGDHPDELIGELTSWFQGARLIRRDLAVQRQFDHVARAIETPASGLDLPLDMRGTAFQQQVWCALQAIPVGRTASYTEIAERIGRPRAVRAVAAACAANRLAIAIPCHRVVRSNGELSGYRWGSERKRQLLQREGARTGL